MGVYRRKAQYHETDQMGIIHHSNYVKWMEEARIDFMKELGFGYGEVEKRGIVSPVAGVSVSYKKPVLFDDVVGISVSVKKYSGVVLELAYEFFNVTRNEVCTRGFLEALFYQEWGAGFSEKRDSGTGCAVQKLCEGGSSLMEVVEMLDNLKEKARRDPALREMLLATRREKEPLAAFCKKCRELGVPVYEMDLIAAGEEFYAAMKRSTNGGGENSPMLEGEDDFYELFFAGLE